MIIVQLNEERKLKKWFDDQRQLNEENDICYDRIWMSINSPW